MTDTPITNPSEVSPDYGVSAMGVLAMLQTDCCSECGAEGLDSGVLFPPLVDIPMHTLECGRCDHNVTFILQLPH